MIVVGSVASGAEVIAGGSIHIYGTLRGGRSPVHATPARGFFAASSKPSFFRSTVYVVAGDMPAHTCAASRFRSGSTVI